jgi:hypothetical protein
MPQKKYTVPSSLLNTNKLCCLLHHVEVLGNIPAATEKLDVVFKQDGVLPIPTMKPQHP